MLKKSQKNFPLKPKQAFSLLEISIVLLVIGVFAAGIVSASALLKKSQISTARSLTLSSPANSTANISMWLEGSLEKSFISGESSANSGLSTWYDIQNTSISKKNATQVGANKPVFSNNLNNVYGVKFDGTSNFFNFNASALNNSDYTIFILEKRSGNKSANYFIGDPAITTTNQNLVLGYSLDGQIIHGQGSSNSYTSNISSFANSPNETKIFTFLHSANAGKKTYINGILAATSSNTEGLSNIDNLTLGKGYEGEIGEVIIFTRALKNSERQDIENYLEQKWFTKINKNSLSCIGGTVTGTSCAASCDTSSLGTTLTSIPQGTSTLTCNTAAGRVAGSFSATCSGTNLVSSGSCSCDTANGYALSGSTCTRTCGLATPVYAVLTSGTSYTIPSTQYYCNVKVWAIGGGGGGGGGASSACSTSRSGGGGAGGVAYKTWAAVAGNSISYSLGAGGSGGNNSVGGNGGTTSVTFNSLTITANGGTGGSNSLATGGSFSGGDGGANGGNGPGMSSGTQSAAGGGAIGGVVGGSATSASGPNPTPAGGSGGISGDVDSLFAALTAASVNRNSNGAGGAATTNFTGRSGLSATGFGCGGGGSNLGGGTGGAGFLGGGGGGGVCTGTNVNTRGGAGGAGAVVIQVY